MTREPATVVLAILSCLLALVGGGGQDLVWGQGAGAPDSTTRVFDDSTALDLMLQRNRELELSDEQIRSIVALRARLQKEVMRHRATMHITELELAELVGGAGDAAATEAKLREVEAARTALRLASMRGVEQARALLTPKQRRALEAAQRTRARAVGAEGAVDPAVRRQVQSVMREELKDRSVVEVETTQAIVNRLVDLAKLLVFIAGIPLAVLGFLGVRRVSNLFALVGAAQKEITQRIEHAKQQVEASARQASHLTEEYQRRKQEADDLALRVQKIQEDADKALQEISAATRLVADEGQKATLEIRMTAAAFKAQPAQAPDAEVRSDTEIITIPVVVHVVYRTDDENISDAQIQSQIDVLNQDYRARNPDISKVPEPFKEFIDDARIEFALATVDP